MSSPRERLAFSLDKASVESLGPKLDHSHSITPFDRSRTGPKMVVGRFGAQSTLEEGVQNTVRLIADPGLSSISGQYFNGDREARAHRQAYDVMARARLRELSWDLCGFIKS